MKSPFPQTSRCSRGHLWACAEFISPPPGDLNENLLPIQIFPHTETPSVAEKVSGCVQSASPKEISTNSPHTSNADTLPDVNGYVQSTSFPGGRTDTRLGDTHPLSEWPRVSERVQTASLHHARLRLHRYTCSVVEGTSVRVQSALAS